MTQISAQAVLERFALLASLPEPEEFLPLCGDAAAELSSAQRDSCGAQAQSALISAAAALAFYRWTLTQAATGAGSFSAGDVKVTADSGRVSQARRLWREAAASAAPYLQDGSFLFGRILP